MLPIPKYKELAVKPIWEHVKEVEELAKYFPTLKDNELPDRAFLWGILGTLRREVWQKLIDEARKVRGKNSLENIDDLIEIHPDFLDKIMKAPTLSKSELIFLLVIYFILDKGRVAFLLKRSKPVRSERKDPKIYSANLRVLSQNSEEEEKQTRQRSLEQFTSHGDDNMNVDIRPENRRTIDPFGQRTTAAQFETPTKREGTSLVKKRFHET